MPEIRERNTSEKPKAGKAAKRTHKRPAATVQMMRYVQRKKSAEHQKREDARNADAVNTAEDTTVELVLDTAERTSRIHRSRQRDTVHREPPGTPSGSHRPEPDTHPQPHYTQQEIIRRADTPISRTSARSTPEPERAALSGSAQGTANARNPQEIKGRPGYEPKTKDSIRRTAPKAGRPEKPLQTAPPISPGTRAAAMGRKRLQQEAQRQTAQQSKKAAKAAGELAQKAAATVASTIKSVASTLIGVLGGVGAAILLGVLLLIGAIVASPFGIFFANEPTADSVSLGSAVAQINMEFAARLNELQEGDYEEVIVEGTAPDWIVVIAVFACRTAGGENAVDVVTLDTERVALLRTVFWDMCTISTEEEAPESTETGPSTETNATEPLPTLHITISAKTAEEMRQIYHFTPAQNKAMDDLLAEEDTLRDMLGDLTISSEAAASLLAALPSELSEERRRVVRQALTLVGKVNYFWGGKSLVLGWDDRWGRLTEVTALGSPSTGTTRPYGMDCSGFTDWVFYNVSGGSYILGHDGGAASQHQYCARISWEQAQPGDLVFYPGDTHVGIVGGWDAAGNIQIIHCASGNLNNVVITGKSGFIAIGRPYYYGE